MFENYIHNAASMRASQAIEQGIELAKRGKAVKEIAKKAIMNYSITLEELKAACGYDETVVEDWSRLLQHYEYEYNEAIQLFVRRGFDERGRRLR